MQRSETHNITGEQKTLRKCLVCKQVKLHFPRDDMFILKET